MQHTFDELLAFANAAKKGVGKAADELNGQVRTALVESFDETHCDRRSIMVGNTKVGEVGLSFNKPRPYIKQECQEEALDMLEDLGLTERVPKRGWEDAFTCVGGEVVHADTGAYCECLGWDPGSVRGATVRGCDPKQVAQAFGERMPSVDIGALLQGNAAKLLEG